MNEIKKLLLGIFPTPMQELHGFRDILGDGNRLFLKRDDLCGIGLGGNKVRKLEYSLADALEKQCDCIVTGGGTLSNQPIAEGFVLTDNADPEHPDETYAVEDLFSLAKDAPGFTANNTLATIEHGDLTVLVRSFMP